MIAEEVVSRRGGVLRWTLEDVEEGVQRLLKETNTNFDSLIKNIENHQELYELVYRILIKGEVVPYNAHTPLMRLGTMYGIFKESQRGLSIHNRLYEQLIYSYMTDRALEKGKLGEGHYAGAQFVKGDGSLDMNVVLRKFQLFMKEQYSRRSRSLIEREWRLIFLAFLKPIINGRGYDFKEV
ncbi:MAG: hypothetical protein NZM39_12435, partial [Bernardetiaceae bacterium]|nr:hypothetical protein [Bernardetiaceae bacterium]